MAEIDKSIEVHENDGLPELAPEPGLEHEPQMEPKQEQEAEESFPEQRPEAQDALGTGGGERWHGWPGESVFRMLVPAQKVGSIIGRKGEFIKKMCEETKARIKILDGPSGTAERAVMVSAKEEPDVSLPPAIDGLLRVHRRVVDGLESDSSHSPRTLNSKVSTKLLVPAAQAGSLIGKQGSTVKSIQEASNCIVRVLGSEDLPVFALPDDRVVEVVGEPTGVHTAIELIASHLKKFLVDRTIIPVFEQQMQMLKPPMEQFPLQPWAPPPQSFHPNAVGGPGYGSTPHFMPPPRQRDNYYPPADMPPPMERAPHQGISAYGRDTPNPPMGMHAPSNNQSGGSSVVTQITQQMQIPLSYADAVIGTNGASISYIRRVSGATVTIQEARGIPGEMTVEINGTASQVQTAQQLIQNFMADAAAPPPQPQTQTAPPPADQGYNAVYAPPAGSMYPPAAPPQNTGIPGQTGGYGSLYGANYGY